MNRLNLSPTLVLLTLVAITSVATPAVADGLTFEQLAAIRTVEDVLLSPDGTHIAYSLSVPRRPGVDDDGPARTEVRMMAVDGSNDRLYLGGNVGASAVRFSPDGSMLTYLAKRDDDEHKALWAIPVDGGESRRLIGFETSIASYRLSPDGARIAFVALEAEAKQREKAKEKGYTQEVFEEDWHPRKVWVVAAPKLDAPAAAPGDDVEEPQPLALEIEGSVYQLEWAPDNTRLALSVAPRPLIDDQYMKRKITIVNATSGEVETRLNNDGKLGAFAWSPDGTFIAMISAADPNDPKEGRLLLARATGGPLRDLLQDLDAHVSAIAWKNPNTLAFLTDVGSEAMYGEVSVNNESRTLHFRSGGETSLPLPRSLSLSADGSAAAFGAESPRHPREVFFLPSGTTLPLRRTDSNPWLADVTLARQEVVTFQARDGLQLEGILVHPLQRGATPSPLILMVHGGPEGHDRNGWVTNYSRPAQLAAARGFASFYPNYRGSTARGVRFSKLGQGDAAGAEFDDLVDAVDHLVASGVADTARVGITGGSYGGYATAWCSTRYSERFRAGVMFVGISNKVSKGLTTEIPNEDVMVHTRFDPWENWQFSLERSPVYHAKNSRTALLIAHGQDDTRVHPSQSLQLYRALKLIGKTPVRYVRYPGEGHGNRRAASRDDYSRRLMRWFEHFLNSDSRELPEWNLEPATIVDDEMEDD